MFREVCRDLQCSVVYRNGDWGRELQIIRRETIMC